MNPVTVTAMTRRLYVWDDVFCDYTPGCAMAIATSKEDAARQVALTKNPTRRDPCPERAKKVEAYIRESIESDIAELMEKDCIEQSLDEPFTFWKFGGG